MSAGSSKPRTWRRRTVVLGLLAMLATAVALRRWVFGLTEMDSRSMQPTLEGNEETGGDLVLIDLLSLRFRAPRRGEVVVFRHDGDTVIKRVAGLPGEVVRIGENWAVTVDGKPHGVSALDRHRYQPFGNVRAGRAYDVPPRGYFVLGDFTRDSYDSRFHGAIHRESIRGRAVWILWPPARFGRVR